MLNKEALKQWKMIKTVTRLQHSWRSSHYFKACDDVDKRLLQSHHQLIKTIIKMVSCIRVLSAMTMHKRSFPNNGLAYSSIDIFRVHTYMFHDIFLLRKLLCLLSIPSSTSPTMLSSFQFSFQTIRHANNCKLSSSGIYIVCPLLQLSALLDNLNFEAIYPLSLNLHPIRYLMMRSLVLP